MILYRDIKKGVEILSDDVRDALVLIDRIGVGPGEEKDGNANARAAEVLKYLGVSAVEAMAGGELVANLVGEYRAVSASKGLVFKGIKNKELQAKKRRGGRSPHTSPFESFDIVAMRKLLLAAFNSDDLRRFCMDRDAFKPILSQFGPADKLGEMVDRVIDYCDRMLLFGDLLAEIEKVNPRQFARFMRSRGS